jgi:hypothetical protein
LSHVLSELDGALPRTLIQQEIPKKPTLETLGRHMEVGWKIMFRGVTIVEVE